MNLIERLYVAYYRYALWQRSRFNYQTPLSWNPRFNSIFWLSFFTLLNVMSILKLLKIAPLMITKLFDGFVILALIAAILIYIFEKDSRYKEILEKHNTPSELGKIEILGWTYTILTVVFFFVVYEEFF